MIQLVCPKPFYMLLLQNDLSHSKYNRFAINLNNSGFALGISAVMLLSFVSILTKNGKVLKRKNLPIGSCPNRKATNSDHLFFKPCWEN